MAKTIQRFNRTGSTQNRPHHGRPKKLSARAQRHIQRLCLGKRRMSAASIAAEVEGLGGQPVNDQTIRLTLHQIGLHGCRPRRKPLLKIMHKKARKLFAEDHEEPCPVVWWDQDKLIWFRWCQACVAATRYEYKDKCVRHSLIYIVAKCHFFSVVTGKDIIKYLQKCEGCTHFWDTVYI